VGLSEKDAAKVRISLTIPDELFDIYTKRAEEMQGRSGKTASPEELMQKQLDTFKWVHPSDRVIVITSKDRERLEEILSGGTLRDSKDFVDKVQALADIQIGQVRVDFSPGQLMELKKYAGRNNRSLEEVTKATVAGMSYQFFNHLQSD
jgi:hypothetical protein